MPQSDKQSAAAADGLKQFGAGVSTTAQDMLRLIRAEHGPDFDGRLDGHLRSMLAHLHSLTKVVVDISRSGVPLLEVQVKLLKQIGVAEDVFSHPISPADLATFLPDAVKLGNDCVQLGASMTGPDRAL